MWIITTNNYLLALYGVAIVLILGVLSLSVQAQYSAEPTDFDRLLSGEFNAVSPPNVTNSNCDTSANFDCSGVLYLRMSPTLNIGDSTDSGGNQLVVRMEARAGQEAIGNFLTPGICRDAAGNVIPLATSALLCTAFGGVDYTPEVDGTINADNPANLLFNVEARFTYSKEIFPGNPDTFTTVCTGATGYLARVSPNPPRNVASSYDNGVITYSYESANQGLAPGTLTEAQRIQYPANEDDYAELMTLTCNLPASASNQLLGMSYHLSAYGNAAFGHHIGVTAGDSYVTSPENSLEFLPLDGSNYIAHAEITEGGDGVLIEYAQAVAADSTSTATYKITAADGSDIAITPSITWLNNQTVWLTLGSDIYTGVNTGSDVALDADRHVLVTSTFPDDTAGFGDNFDQASTYRAVLTRHMSQVDLDQTAPRIMDVTVADGTESIALTFSEAVCGATEAAVCTTLTADHFEVMYYKGGISETEESTPLTISSVGLTGDATNGYTAATLNIDLPGSIDASGSSVTIDTNDYLLVRTARNSRFSDTFITDRTIFSQSSTQTTGGMLHLQSGAMVQAIPTITYSLAVADADVDIVSDSADVEDSFDDTNAPNYFIDEGNASEDTTVTFTVTRAPTGYNVGTATTVTIMNTAGGNPEGFRLWVGGLNLTGNFTNISQPITFTPGEDEPTIVFMWTGDDDSSPDPDNVYTISIAGETITFTIRDDEQGITLLPPNPTPSPTIAIAEIAVEREDGVQGYIEIYPDADADDIITEVGVAANTVSITEIVLTFTGIVDSVVAGDIDTVAVRHNRSFTEGRIGNEFTFSSSGAAINVAEDFLKSLEFGIESDEPTGFLTGSTTPRPMLDNVTVALAIDAMVGTPAAPAEADGMAIRTIEESNDSVELGTVPAAVTLQG